MSELTDAEMARYYTDTSMLRGQLVEALKELEALKNERKQYPAECVKCSAKAPVIGENDDCAGWLCPKCLSDLECEDVIKERDEAEECINKIYAHVTGSEPIWSNNFDYAEAIDMVEQIMHAKEQENGSIQLELAHMRDTDAIQDRQALLENVAALTERERKLRVLLTKLIAATTWDKVNDDALLNEAAAMLAVRA